jgi:phage tail sheath protein FI
MAGTTIGRDRRAPDVHREDVFPAPVPGFVTGVPVFLGYAGTGPYEPQMLTLWPQFAARFGPPLADGYLADAVRGFFENDGMHCHVLRLDDRSAPADALRQGLAALDHLEDVDLVAAPDIMRTEHPSVDPDPAATAALQRGVLDHCRRRRDRFALLDADPTGVERQRAQLVDDDGALYHPWVWVPGRDGPPRYVPPCGHVAGVYSRSDRAVGVHKAPANEVIEGVLDLRADLDDAAVGELSTGGVNCLRALPGRGIRVWGARTLSDDPTWRHVNVRRVFLTLGRWLERYMAGLVHEANDVRLRVRIMRDLSAHLDGLFQQGALKGRTADDAFFVKCDSETNPPEVVDAGMVVTHVGLAPAAPAELVVARIVHGASGVSITTDI